MINKTVIEANKLIKERKNLENVNKQLLEEMKRLDEKMGMSVNEIKTIDELVEEEARIYNLETLYKRIYINRENIRSGDTPFEERTEIADEFEKFGIKITYWTSGDVGEHTFKGDCEKILIDIEKYRDIIKARNENHMQIQAIAQALKNIADKENSVLEGNLKEHYKDAKEYIEKTTLETKKEFYELLKKDSKNQNDMENEEFNREDIYEKLEIEKYQDEMKRKCKLYSGFNRIEEDENQSSINRMDMINNPLLRKFAEKTESSLEQLGYYSEKWNPVAMSFSKGKYAVDIKTIQRSKYFTKKDIVEADEKFLLTQEDVEKVPEVFERFPVLKNIMKKVKSVINKEGEER